MSNPWLVYAMGFFMGFMVCCFLLWLNDMRR